MLTYSFTNIGSDSLYHHLYHGIREDILCGNLTAETKLPSKRSFAKNLGVSNITVENAYSPASSRRIHLLHSQERVLCQKFI